MITKADFDKIYKETQDAVIETFDFIKKKRSPWNYIQILAEAAYKEELKGTGLSPYVIDNRTDKRIDNTRLDFYQEFLNTYYSFDKYSEIDDNTYRIHLEMMIYSHIWESKPFLKNCIR